MPESSHNYEESKATRIANLSSPIFWRITAGVFASILLIEVALLVFSWHTEQKRQINGLKDSINAVTTLLDPINPIPQLDQLIKSTTKSSKYQIIGYIYRTSTGTRHSGGNNAALDEVVFAGSPQHYSNSKAIYSTYQSKGLLSTDANELWLRVDASWISDYMEGYILRIMVMILLISVFVTVACLVFLNPLLIKPLQRLNRLLVRAEQHGLASTVAYSKDLTRRDEIGSVFRSFSHFRNELILAEKDRAFNSTRFEDFANLGADCFWEIDAQENFTYFAGDTHTCLSGSSDEILGTSIRTFIDENSDVDSASKHVLNELHENGVWEGSLESPVKGQSARTVRIATNRVDCDSGDSGCYRGTIVDISQETELRATLRYQATHDDLTGLCNRRELADRIEQSIEDYSSNNTTFSLLTLDLDRFKQINDICGHIAGDMLLKRISSIMQAQVEESDTIARTGGDEFVLLLNDTNLQDAQLVAENIRRGIESYLFIWGAQSFSVSASLGVAEIAADIATAELIVLASDNCCLAAKRKGKNQIRVYSPGDDSVAVNRDEALWISRINDALKNDHFRLFKQTIERVDQTPEEHFELLIRLKDDTNGFWPPNLFLPVAEKNELMPMIDRWVVTKAFLWIASETISEDIDFCMNINLSAASLANSEFQRFLRDIIDNNTALNKHVCFEMTESAAMMNPEETIALLEYLRESGCKVALDDFGTGFSSLSQIRTLPLDYIKIDGAFIQEIHLNELDQALVKSISDIARVLNIKTVAEFVDSNEALKKLEELNIDYAQGYLISKPEALDFTAVNNDSRKAA